MKLSNIFLSAALTFVSSAAFSQIGRHEQPIDTIEIGGKEQEMKMEQMQTQDELASALHSLNDSVTTFLSVHKQTASTTNSQQGITQIDNLKRSQKSLQELLSSLEQTERSDVSVEKGYAILEEVRREFKAAKARHSPKMND